MISDGVSYLDLADLYARGRYWDALNAYWSPLYIWLLALVRIVFNPTPGWERFSLHVLNACLLVIALGCFEWFFKRLTGLIHETRSRMLPDAAWWVLGYAIFIWASLYMIGTLYPSADLLVMAIIFVLSGLLIQARRRLAGVGHYLLFGGLLALGYYTKTAFAAISLGYFASLAWVTPRSQWKRILLSVMVFLALIAPFVAALSIKQHRFTIGDSGRLNYAWEMLGVERVAHWQEGLHPTRQLATQPAVYEFSGHAGTYSPWYDPAYWHEGLRLGFNAAYLVPTTLTFLALSAVLLLSAPGIVPFLLFRRFRPKFGIRGCDMAFLLVPSLFPAALYSLVMMESRYLGGSLAVAALAVLSYLSISERPKQLFLLVISTATCAALIGMNTLLGAIVLAKWARNGYDPHAVALYSFAEQLRAHGLRPGAKIARIGDMLNQHWARLAGAQIIAEIPIRLRRHADLRRSLRYDYVDTDLFWASSASKQERILDLFARAGAEMVVAEYVPEWADTTGWHEFKFPVRNTDDTDEDGVRRKLALYFRELRPAVSH